LENRRNIGEFELLFRNRKSQKERSVYVRKLSETIGVGNGFFIFQSIHFMFFYASH